MNKIGLRLLYAIFCYIYGRRYSTHTKRIRSFHYLLMKLYLSPGILIYIADNLAIH